MKLAKVEQGLRTRKLRDKRWYMYRQEGPSWDLAKYASESTGNEFSCWSIKVVNPHSGSVLAKIGEIVWGEWKPTQA